LTVEYRTDLDEHAWQPAEGAVLITGGTSGIGLAVATALALRGRPVLAIGRSPQRCHSAEQALLKTRGEYLVAAADSTQPDSLAGIVGRAEARWGTVTGLVTAAGRLARGSLASLPIEDLRAVLEVNVVGTWLAIRAVLPGMLTAGFGRIVTIGSVLGSTGAPERAGYAASKGAIAALTRSVALELAGTGVTANCVAPGPIRTPMNANDAAQDAAAQASFAAKVPVGRWGRPEDVAYTVLPLLATESSFTTGSLVHVDGGYTAQ
jgi:NAD(P)-dependent dehydrogenase (short-subunit alcohol dehydrogenase family)